MELGLPREGIGAQKFVPSFEVWDNKFFCWGFPRICRERPDQWGARAVCAKKFVLIFGP